MNKSTVATGPVSFSDSASETTGIVWQKTLGASEKPALAIQAILRSVSSRLAAQFVGRAAPSLDSDSNTITLTLRLAEPEGSTKVFRASITLLVDDLVPGVDTVDLTVLPWIRAEAYRQKDHLGWFARDVAADVDMLVNEIQTVLETFSP